MRKKRKNIKNILGAWKREAQKKGVWDKERSMRKREKHVKKRGAYE